LRRFEGLLGRENVWGYPQSFWSSANFQQSAESERDWHQMRRRKPQEAAVQSFGHPSRSRLLKVSEEIIREYSNKK
jgi:hypothetical protein